MWHVIIGNKLILYSNNGKRSLQKKTNARKKITNSYIVYKILLIKTVYQIANITGSKT